MGRLVGSGWLQSCLATGASLILAVSWDNGDDGGCVFSRLVCANSHGVRCRDLKSSDEDKPCSSSTSQVFFGVIVIIVPLLKVSHMVQPIGHRGGRYEELEPLLQKSTT